MSHFIVEATSASGLVASALAALADDRGDWTAVAPRGQPTREFSDVTYTLTDVSLCAAWLPERRLNYAFMVAEFVWILCGRADVESIAHYNSGISRFSDDGRTFFGAYGPRWRDQLGGALSRLRGDPTTRQAVITTWRPEYNEETGAKDGDGGDPVRLYMETRDVPCTVATQYRLRGGVLDASVFMRSSDAWLGLPYDVFNFASLQRAVAAELGAEGGSLSVHIGSTHLYERDLPRVREVLAARGAALGATPDEASARERVLVPRPPGADCRRIAAAEEALRRGRDFADAADLLGDERGWLPYLEVLHWRNHRERWRVMGSFRELLPADAERAP